MGFNLTLSPLTLSPPGNARSPYCLLKCPHHKKMLLSHNHTHRHAKSTETTHSTHCTQLPSCNCDLSGVVVKWCPMRMLSAPLHHQSLGNDKPIYRNYLSTYPVVTIVHGWTTLVRARLTDRPINQRISL